MSRLLKKKDVCRLRSVSPAGLDRWEAAGAFPRRIRLNGVRCAWWESEVWKWLECEASRPLDLTS